ncbi:MAG: hypothetical protein R6U11_06185 [Bacteroidales bacterium]
MKTVFQIALYVVIIVLGFFIYRSIMEPINFRREAAHREERIIQRLKDIRNIQVAHRSTYGVFNSSLDSLVDFVKYDSMPIVEAIGAVPDSLTEKEALDLGIVQRDTSWMDVKDTLYHKKKYPVDSIPYVPFSGGERFEMNAGVIERGLVEIPVFEARTPAEVYMKGLDDYKTYYTREELKVGSMEQSSTDGNWE